MKVMIVVTHLLGTGHLRRAGTLAHAFADHGHDVRLISGGMPLDAPETAGIDLLQLPPVRSDGVNFARLLDRHGVEAGESLREARRDMLCNALDDFIPDVLVTELYPFGRRVLAREFDALLERAASVTPRPVVLASIRDILAPPSSPAKAERTEHIVTSLYDAVLVHSDPQLVSLEASWPVGPALADRLRYSGFIAPPPAGPHPDGLGQGEVLVSAGGGAVGMPLFRAALQAARIDPDRHWRLLVGGADANRVKELQAEAAPSISVEPARPDFRQMLAGAAASISLCGYNTALDILQAGTPAVFLPFDAGNEVEQGLRAHSLARLPGIEVLKSHDLSPTALCEMLARVIAAPKRNLPQMRFDGATRSVAIASDLLETAR